MTMRLSLGFTDMLESYESLYLDTNSSCKFCVELDCLEYPRCGISFATSTQPSARLHLDKGIFGKKDESKQSAAGGVYWLVR
jgi:hypothetical protein